MLNVIFIYLLSMRLVLLCCSSVQYARVDRPYWTLSSNPHIKVTVEFFFFRIFFFWRY